MFEHPFKVKDGEPVIKFAHKVKEHISSLKDGDYGLTIKTQQSMKSEKQRGYWYGVVYNNFFKTEGWTRLEFDDYFLQQFGARQTITDRLTKKEKIVVKTVSAHTHKEMSEFIDESVIHCRHDLGMNVPDPDPEWKINKPLEGKNHTNPNG